MRPREHVVGDIAATQFTELLQEHDLSVGKNEKDYGEDLIVEALPPSYEIHTRFYVQVKGTYNISAHEGAEYYKVRRIKRSTAIKWLESHDLILLVLWDVKEKRGVYALVSDILERNQCEEGSGEYLSLRIPSKNELNKHTVKYLISQVINAWCIVQHRIAFGEGAFGEDGHQISDAEGRSATKYLNFLDLIKVTRDKYGKEDLTVRDEVRHQLVCWVADEITEQALKKSPGRDRKKMEKLVKYAYQVRSIYMVLKAAQLKFNGGVVPRMLLLNSMALTALSVSDVDAIVAHLHDCAMRGTFTSLISHQEHKPG